MEQDLSDHQSFDPSLTGSHENGLFGIPTELESSAIALIPVPWEATTSYGGGTSDGPDAILKASPQLDLYTRDLPNHYEKGFHWFDESNDIKALNKMAVPMAKNVIEALERGENLNDADNTQEAVKKVNEASHQVNQFVYQTSQRLLSENKTVGVVGGDHSSPYGLIKALSEKHDGQFGILHVDAHLDLRQAYQGFEHSHASIMYNVMNLKNPPHSLVQVGIRDFSEEEHQMAKSLGRVFCYYDQALREDQFLGVNFSKQVENMLDHLPQRVYISFDVDGLDPALCPSTGTPVPGGLSYAEAIYLIRAVVASGRHIIGFDLCEVSPNQQHPDDEFDGNVGARLLFNLCSWTMESQNNA